VNNGFPNGANTQVQSIAINGSKIFAGTIDGVFSSTNNGSSWNASGLTNEITSILISGNNVFAGTKDSGVYLSKIMEATGHQQKRITAKY